VVPSHNLKFICRDIFIIYNLRSVVIVRFVDIGGIVDYHCLSIPFIK